MGLADAISAGVAVARGVLSSGGLLVSVSRYARASVNNYGEPQYGPTATATLSALQEDIEAVIRDAHGEEVVARGRLTILGGDAVESTDKLVLPGGGVPRILRIDRGVQSASGAFLTQVYLD